MSMDHIQLSSTSLEQISLEDFLQLGQEAKTNIKSITIVPPSLGNLDENDDFGSFLVEYKTPIYQVKS